MENPAIHQNPAVLRLTLYGIYIGFAGAFFMFETFTRTHKPDGYAGLVAGVLTIVGIACFLCSYLVARSADQLRVKEGRKPGIWSNVVLMGLVMLALLYWVAVETSSTPPERELGRWSQKIRAKDPKCVSLIFRPEHFNMQEANFWWQDPFFVITLSDLTPNCMRQVVAQYPENHFVTVFKSQP